jgi:hypothetical protein
LADCNGNFELDIPVILGKLKANRPDLSIRKLEIIFDTFKKEGLAFVWSVVRRQYIHWTRSERRGRLPRPSRRSNKYEKKLAPPLPLEEYKAYLHGFGETLDVSASDALALAKATATDRAKEKDTAQASPSPEYFAIFWKNYPNKVGKPAAQKAWKRVKWDELTAIRDGLNRWKATEQWQKEGGKYIPYPATFLNQRRWEDEPAEVKVIRELDAMVEQVAFGVPPVAKCKCGVEIPAGFLKCLKCLKAKPPVNP